MLALGFSSLLLAACAPTTAAVGQPHSPAPAQRAQVSHKVSAPPMIAIQSELPKDAWVSYENEFAGISVDLPPSWQRVDVDESANSYLQEFYQASANPFLFEAVDMTEEAALVTSLNIVKEELAFPMPLSLYMAATKRMANHLFDPIGEIETRIIELEVGEVGVLSLRMQGYGDLSGEVLAVSTYVIKEGREVHAISFGSLAEFEQAYAPVAESIVNSFKFTPSSTEPTGLLTMAN